MKKAKSVRAVSFNSKLAAYSATAAAALVAAPSAEATIQDITTFSVNGGVNFTTTAPTVGAASSTHSVAFIAGTAGHKSAFVGNIVAGHGQPFTSSSHGLAKLSNAGHALAQAGGLVANLSYGSVVKNKNFGNVNILASRARTISHVNASRGFIGTGYVGFKTHLHGKTYYGWLNISVEVDNNGNPDGVTLKPVLGPNGVFGAFGLASDDITAGEVATPEPASLAIGGLGLLALGARGVREIRRRRKQEKLS